MKKLFTILITWCSLLSIHVMADDLYSLDHVPLGSDANTVERLCPTLKRADFRMDPDEKWMGKVMATAKLEGRFWDGVVLALPDGRLESVAYVNAFAAIEKKHEIVPVIFEELLRRYGRPDQVLACERLTMEGKRNAPLFLWKMPDRVIAFSYTPFDATTDGKMNVGLQVMIPDLPLSQRYKVVEVPPAEMEQLTVDVAGITAPQVSPAPIANGTTGQGRSPYLWPVVGIVGALAIAAGFILVKKAGRPR